VGARVPALHHLSVT